MIAAPAVGLVAAAVGPTSEDEVSEQIATVAEHPDAFLASILLGFLALVLLVPAILGMTHPLRTRAVLFGNVGGALALVGVIGLASTNALNVALYEMASNGADRGEMVALAERIEENPAFIVLLVMFLGGLGLGLLLLSIASWRAGTAPGWAPPLLATAIALGSFGTSKPVQIAFYVVLIAVLGSISLRHLSLSDRDWEAGRTERARR